MANKSNRGEEGPTEKLNHCVRYADEDLASELYFRLQVNIGLRERAGQTRAA
jgi:hypothetical protein